MNKIKYVIFFKILITLVLIDSNTSKANSFGLQIFLPHIHLSPESVSFGEKYSYKIDDKGWVVWTPGLKLFYDSKLDKSIWNISLIRFAASYSKDCMNQNSYVFHLGPRWKVRFTKNIRFVLGLGSTLWLRKTWEIFPFYKKSEYMKTSSRYLRGFEYIFLPLSGDFDIEFDINKTWTIIYSFIPAYPYVFSQSIGIIIKI